MHDIHFIVHQGIDGFLQDLNRQEMSRCIDHQPSVIQKGLIFYVKRYVFNRTFFVFVPGAPDRLHESLKSANESNIGDGPNLSTSDRGSHLILLLLSFEYAFKGRVIDRDLNLKGKIFDIDVESGGNYNIGNSAMQGLPHLKGDHFFNMFICVLFEFYVEEQLAWVSQSHIIFPTGDLARHWEEVQLLALISGVHRGEECCQGEEGDEVNQLHNQLKCQLLC